MNPHFMDLYMRASFLSVTQLYSGRPALKQVYLISKMYAFPLKMVLIPHASESLAMRNRQIQASVKYPKC